MIFPNPWSHFHVAPNLGTHPSSRFGTVTHCNLGALTRDRKNKWEIVGLMDRYYVVEVTPILYSGLEVLINIISKEDIAYCVTSGNIRHCIFSNLTRMSSQPLGKKGEWCTTNIFIMRWDLYARWIMILRSPFTLSHLPSMRLYGYLNLPMLLSVNNFPNLVFARVVENASDLYWCGLLSKKITNGLVVFGNIHGNRPFSYLCIQNINTLLLVDYNHSKIIR